jgi:hypothetical protein
MGERMLRDCAGSRGFKLRAAFRKRPEASFREEGMLFGALMLAGVGEQMSEPDGELENLQIDT